MAWFKLVLGHRHIKVKIQEKVAQIKSNTFLLYLNAYIPKRDMENIVLNSTQTFIINCQTLHNIQTQIKRCNCLV